MIEILLTAAMALNASNASSAQAASLSAHDIMVKDEAARKLSTVTSEATLTTGGGNSTERVKKFSWWRKLQADGVHYDTLTRFHFPAEVRDEGILFLEHDNGQSDVLLYLPTFKKTRRVERQAQSGSFMGSEFSYADIATPHVDDYEQKTLREEACPGGGQCTVIESTPKTDEVRERTGYSKTVEWVRKDNFMAEKAEYYGADGSVVKKLEATQIKEVDPAHHKWMAHHLRVENPKTGRFTVLEFANVKVNQPIPDSTFTQQKLERVR